MAGHRPATFLHLVNIEQPLRLATYPLQIAPDQRIAQIKTYDFTRWFKLPASPE
ncbi:hypothetical protein PoB_002324400, partial [Plakobranchus ocellatus]